MTDVKNDKMNQQLLERVHLLERELDEYKQRSPLVGVVWYGDGGIGIGLKPAISGADRLSLDGYGDKGIINYSDWLRMKTSEEVIAGVLVRDDSVIEELGETVSVAKPDKSRTSNSFKDSEILDLLNGPITSLRRAVSEFTHHFAGKHFVRVARHNKITDRNKLSVIMDKYKELFIRYQFSLMRIHDLKTAVDLRQIDISKNESEESIREKVIRHAIVNDDYADLSPDQL